MEMEFRYTIENASAPQYMIVVPFMDGTSNNWDWQAITTATVTNTEFGFILRATIVPSVGTHLFQPAWQSNGGAPGMTMPNRALSLTVQEIVRQEANNGTS